MENKNLKIHQTIINKVLEDEGFKNNLISSPEETLATIGFQFENPNNTKIEVVDQTDASKIYINIPQVPIGDDMELTDEQLEIVAGGAGSECNCDIHITVIVKGNSGGDININL